MIVVLAATGFGASSVRAQEASNATGACADYGVFDQFLVKDVIVQDWYRYLVGQYRCQPVTQYFLKLLSVDESLTTKMQHSHLSALQIKQFYQSLEALLDIDWQNGDWDSETEMNVKTHIDTLDTILKSISNHLPPAQFDFLREQVLIGIPSDFA